MSAFARLIGALLLLLVVGHPALAEERILRFSSDVHIARSGDLDVTETIRLVSEGQEIRRGIQRDFPTSYRNPLGQRSRVGFSIISVARDGQSEPYEIINLFNGKRIRIGRAEILLPPGEHLYEIHYRTTRQTIYGKDHDELYWNATGTGWTFPIEIAEARITLPSPAHFGNRAFYTGPQGSTAHDAAVVAEVPGSIVFRTTQPLPRENGLTVAAAFPKGVLDEPGIGRRFGWWFGDWGMILAGIAALATVIGYYIRAWAVVGRGPRAGPIVPQFTPPEGLTAAASRYISRMKLDNRAFTAAIVDLAVRGHVHISKEGDGWFTRGTTTLTKVEGGKPIPAPETALVASLFEDGDTIELKQDNHSRLQTARSGLGDELESTYCGTMFEKHGDWAGFGLLVIAAAVLGLVLLAALARGGVGATAPLIAIGSFACAWFIQRFRPGSITMLGKVGFWLATAALILFGIFNALPALMGALINGAWPVLLPLLAIPVALTAFSWMYAPTKDGRVVMDQIAGFKRYLGITEEARLETLHPPEKTPELFERYLPYAIALDVENHWAQRFAGVLAAAAATGSTAHMAGWYSGSGNVWADPGGFAGSVGSSLASTISSASTSPSSSDGGSSGGASSGGGGGGGGGSGW